MRKKENLAAFMADVICQLEVEGRLGTAHVYRSTLRRVMDFSGGISPCFSDVTTYWLKAFQNYLIGRNLQWNSVSTYMRMLRAIYFRAVDAGKAPYRPRLFSKVYTGTRVTVKRSVDEDTLHRLKTLQLPADSGLDKARMLFLLLFMLRGIPFVDLAYLRRSDFQQGCIAYRRRKTGAWLSVKVEPEALKLIERLQNKDSTSFYLFPFVSGQGAEAYTQYQHALRRFNACLKQLGGLKEIGTALSSYSARHSWATIANYRNYQCELICNAMGHSSVKVTETYLKPHTDERIKQMNRDIISYVFC